MDSLPGLNLPLRQVGVCVSAELPPYTMHIAMISDRCLQARSLKAIDDIAYGTESGKLNMTSLDLHRIPRGHHSVNRAGLRRCNVTHEAQIC